MPAAPFRFAFVKANWHASIVDRALDGFHERLAQTSQESTVEVFDVPGAFELPLRAQGLAQAGGFDAIVAAALVVDGGIYRHDFVAAAVISGLMEVQLKTGTPVLSVSLTPHHFQDTAHHIGIFREHFVLKGREAADAALMIGKTRATARGCAQAALSRVG